MKHIHTFESFLNENLNEAAFVQLNEGWASISDVDYDRINNAFETHKKEIKDALTKGSRNEGINWDIEVLPKYDNKIGGYNLQAFAVDKFTKHKHVLDSHRIKDAIREVKALPFVSKASVSRSYRKDMVTAIAIGLKIK